MAWTNKSVERVKLLCSESNIPYRISMATNGVYGNTKRQYIIENFSRITLSLDGPEGIHNRSRVLVSGKGSFQKAFETATFFYKNSFPFRIRTTVSKQDSQRMLEIFEFFQSHFPRIVVNFEPLNPIGRGLNSEELPPTQEEFTEGYLSIIDAYGTGYVNYSAIDASFGLKKKYCSPVACPEMNLSVEGNIHSCSRSGRSTKFDFGRYEETTRTFHFDTDIARNLQRISVDDFHECDGCFARYNCAGDCHDLRDIGFNRCTINRAILWHLLDRELEKEKSI